MHIFLANTAVVTQTCSMKKLFSKISQKPQKNICLGVFFNKDPG